MAGPEHFVVNATNLSPDGRHSALPPHYGGGGPTLPAPGAEIRVNSQVDVSFKIKPVTEQSRILEFLIHFTAPSDPEAANNTLGRDLDSS